MSDFKCAYCGRSLRKLILKLIDESATNRPGARKFSVREMAAIARYLVLQRNDSRVQTHG
jgi:hypothetical protein